MTAIPEQVTPLLGWELGMQEVSPGQSVVVVNCHTVVGALRFYVGSSDLRRWCDDLLLAAKKADEPQLLKPVTGLLAPNGMPLTPMGVNGHSPLPQVSAPMPPDETIHPSGGFFPDSADDETRN